MKFKRHKDSDERQRSAAVAIKAILKLDLYPQHKRKLLSRCIWFLTEADGKQNTRFQSRSARNASKNELRHEHVFTRKYLIDELLKPGCDINKTIKHAIGCLVTVKEHAKLHEVKKSLSGWKRYSAAQVQVIDTATGKPISLTAK